MPPQGGPPQRSNKLAQARNGADDLTDRIFAKLFTGVRNDLARYALDFPHAEPNTHQARTNAHDPAHHSAEATAFRSGGLDECFGARHAFEQRLHLVGRTFFGEEVEDYANGLLGNRLIYADGRDDAPDQLVHGPSPPCTDGRFLIVILNFSDFEYKRALQRSTRQAVLHRKLSTCVARTTQSRVSSRQCSSGMHALHAID